MWSITGQNKAVSLLKRSLETGSLAHAYLFIGPARVGKMTLALNLAQALNCEATEPPCGQCVSCQKIIAARHADIHIIGLGNNVDSSEARPRAEISIDQIREVQHSASLPPFEGKFSMYIINGAELLSTEAANCLLKTLEEPEGKVVFVLLTTNERLLPATVISRCQRVELPPLAVNEVEVALNRDWGVEPEKARLLARLSHGCPGWAISAHLDGGLLQQRTERLDELLEIIDADPEERFVHASRLATQFSQSRVVVQERLDLWIDWWRDLMLVKVGCNDDITNVDQLDMLVDREKEYSLTRIQASIKSIRAAGEQLRQNASPRLVLEALMLGLPEVIRQGKRVPAA